MLFSYSKSTESKIHPCLSIKRFRAAHLLEMNLSMWREYYTELSPHKLLFRDVIWNFVHLTT